MVSGALGSANIVLRSAKAVVRICSLPAVAEMYYATKESTSQFWTSIGALWARTSRFNRYVLGAGVGWLLSSLLLRLADEKGGQLTLYRSMLWLHRLLLHGFVTTGFSCTWPVRIRACGHICGVLYEWRCLQRSSSR